MSAAVRAASEAAWLRDLSTMLAEAGTRFGDVSWRTDSGELIHAHKAIVYSRAAGSFQHRFLNAPPVDHDPTASNLSLLYQHSRNSNSDNSQLPTTLHDSSSLLPTTAAPTLSLNGTDSAFFQACLEFLYTGSQEMETVFTVLFDGFEDEGLAQNGRNGGGIERLRQDLIFCWRSKLFPDVQLIIGDPASESTTSFASHRAILSSRSPYFHSLFLGGYGDSHLTTLYLPSPPFTPASTTFCLGWIYSGTLDYGVRTFDLSTGLDIWRCATYLGLGLLMEEVEFKIEGMLNLKRAARVYAFALRPDVCSERLQASAAEFVVGQFSDVWACSTIGNLEFAQQSHLVHAVCTMITPTTLVALTRSTHALRKKVELEKSTWASHIRSMTEGIEASLILTLSTHLGKVVRSEGWADLIDGVGWSTDVVEWILEMVLKGLGEKNAGMVYQELVGSVLLREGGILMDTRILVEEAKNGVIKFMKLRWMSIRSARGFDKLESWALKEISDEIEVPIEELQASSPKPLAPRTTARKLVSSTSSDTRPNLATRAAARLGNSKSGEGTPVRGTRLSSSMVGTRVLKGGTSSTTTPTVGSSRIAGTIVSSSPSLAAPRSTTTTTTSLIRPSPVTPIAPTSTLPIDNESTSNLSTEKESTRRPSLTASVRSATSLSANRSTPPSTMIRATPRTPTTSTNRPTPNSTAFPTTSSSSNSPLVTAGRMTRTTRISGPPAPTTSSTMMGSGTILTKRSNSAASNPSIDRRRPASAATAATTLTLSTDVPPPLPSSTPKTRSSISTRPPFSTSASTSKRPTSSKGGLVGRTTTRSGAMPPTTTTNLGKIRTPVKSTPSAVPSTSKLAPPPALSTTTMTTTTVATRNEKEKAKAKEETKLPGLRLLAGIPCIVTAHSTPPPTSTSSPTASSSSHSHSHSQHPSPTNNIHSSTNSPTTTTTMTTKSIQFKAIVRYIGSVYFAPGEWVGIEILGDSIPSGGLIGNGVGGLIGTGEGGLIGNGEGGLIGNGEGEIGGNDGSIAGVRYFDLLGGGERGRGSPAVGSAVGGEEGLLSAPMRRGGRRSRSADGGSSRSSLGSENGVGGASVGAFVRPNQVVYVL